MKLQSKKARVPIAALGVVALCAGGMGVMASSAFAAGTPLTLSPGATTQAVANVGTATTAAANAAYALKVTDASTTEAVAIKFLSGPTNGALAYQLANANTAATAGTFGTVTAANTAGTNETQAVTITGAPTGGTFTLTYAGQTTAAIAYNADAVAVEAALEALSNIDDVAVAGGPGPTTPYTVTFQGTLAGTNVAQMTATGSFTGGTSPAIAVTTVTPGVPANDDSTDSLGPVLSTDYLYVTGNVPGTYTYQLFQDTNVNGVYDDTLNERAAPTITLTVYDAGGLETTLATTDDVAPVIAATSPVNIGRPVVAGITYNQPLSLIDARGNGTTLGIAGRLAALTFVDVTSEDTATGTGTVAGVPNATNQPATYTPATQLITYNVGTPSEAGTVDLRADLKPTQGAAETSTTRFGTRSVAVASTNVDTLVLAATDVLGSVETTGTNVAVKEGTATVTYTATATDANPGPVVTVPGATVYFTLGGDNVANLTTNGTAVAGEPNVYTRTANADGVASLTVTSSATAATDSYTVDAESNDADAAALTATYAAPAAVAIENTNTVAELTPEVGSPNVVLKGRVIDQFGAAFSPAGASPQQVTVEIPDGTTAGFATITNGAFSYTYTPATTPVAGSTVSFDFLYGSLSDGATEGGLIRYASSVAATGLTLTTPAAGASTVTLQDSTIPNATQANGGTTPFGNTTGEVTGTVTDAGGAALAYKTVVLTGSDGVYFSSTGTPTTAPDDDLVKTITVVSNAQGVFGGAFAYFTKSGSATVTATSGTVSKAATVTTQPSQDPYTISIEDITGRPGSTLIVTGTITDAFGNGVPNATADLSVGTSTLGAFGNNQPTTNSAGVFSTTFVSGTNQSGTADLVATIFGQTQNAKAAVDYLNNAGLVVADGDFQDTATLTLSDLTLVLDATPKITAGAQGADSTLFGTFQPSTSLEIYAKASGARTYQLIDSLKTDEEGKWETKIRIKKSTYFLARASGLSSASYETKLYSKVSLTAKALGGGRVSLYANGDPNVKAPLNFYRAISGTDQRLKTVTSGIYGSATVTVTLPRGTRSVYATYTAPGTGKGTSRTVKITVK